MILCLLLWTMIALRHPSLSPAMKPLTLNKLHSFTLPLTPYKETPEYDPNFPEPSPELIDGEPEWEVEQILGTRRQCNQLQYMVRWKGFSETHDSWEPVNNVHAKDLIENFHWQNPNTICTSDLINPPITPTVMFRSRLLFHDVSYVFICCCLACQQLVVMY